jgi:hypothetical protein
MDATAAGPGIPAMSLEEVERLMTEIDAGEGSGKLAPEQAPKVEENPLALKEFVNADQLRRDVEFNVNDLDNAIQRHASLFVYYANQARLAGRQFERMKAAFEIMESRLDHLWRETLKSSGKATEAQITAAVKADSRWWKAQQRLIDAKAIYELAKDARNAFDHRRDMIVQVSVDQRVERQGELRIMQARSQTETLQQAGQAANASRDTLVARAKVPA